MWIQVANYISTLCRQSFCAARDVWLHRGRVSLRKPNSLRGLSFAWRSFCIAGMSATLAFGTSAAWADDAELILRSMLEARESVHSGSVIVKGTKRLRGGTDEPRDWQGAVRGKVDFDNQRSLVRFEWKETERTRFFGQNDAERIAKDPKSIPVTTFDMGIQYVRNADYAAYCTHSGPTVRSSLAVFEPTRKYITGNTSSVFYHFFDVLSCNAMDFEAFRRGDGFKTSYDALLDLKLEKLEPTEDGWNLRFQGAGTGFSGTPPVVQVRVQRDGYVPVEFSWIDEGAGASFKSNGKWKSEGGVYVPTSYDFVWDFPEADDHFEYRVEFEWLKINEALEAELFDYHSFHFVDIQKGVHVVDMRDPELPTIGIVGKDGKIASVANPLAPGAPATKKLSRSSWILQLNAVIVAILALWGIARWRG
eukprot:TRINITY_DN61430_c0_g1_i1.p1 TRINITY_DN61430_c0_g1~~TRINITY_DN61430_c0_g1_i1.p1  ORF type:complete len:421 (-),score=28.26 TRINITY_DN61430_c0_g1_i1:59-1321(-)